MSLPDAAPVVVPVTAVPVVPTVMYVVEEVMRQQPVTPSHDMTYWVPRDAAPPADPPPPPEQDAPPPPQEQAAPPPPQEQAAPPPQQRDPPPPRPKDKKPAKGKKPASQAAQGRAVEAPAGGGGGTMLDRGPLAVTIKAGSGAGKSKSFQKRYKGLPPQAAIVSFEVLFEPGFEWSCRGKVGGISVGPGTSSGCRYSKNGASLRLMWEAKRMAPTPFAYVYVPQGSEGKQPQGLRNPPKCGQQLFQSDFKGALKTGTWHRVQLGVKLNTPGRADGQLLFVFDGKARVLDGVMWRTGNEKIEGLGWNVFHGGGCAATKSSSMKIREVQVSPW